MRAYECICCRSRNLNRYPSKISLFVAHRIGLEGRDCNTVVCQDCGATFLDSRFTYSQIKKLYSGYRSEEYTNEREYFEVGYREKQSKFKEVSHVAEVEEFLLPYSFSPMRILDWGGGSGENTPFNDRDVDIYDIGEIPVEFGRKVKAPRPPYDLIVCANLLEHVPHPHELLYEISKVMSKSTILYIEVPNEIKNSAPWHEHINFFTPLSLDKLLTRCGFTILATKQLEVGEYHPYLMAAKLL